ncbi:hypothetical protein HDU85_000996 [Gaertneriomyces sp. JEL0708]|nr:hypothetical protein HDU85_000996 [Gaertneriomyces sp. JEL0708]
MALAMVAAGATASAALDFPGAIPNADIHFFYDKCLLGIEACIATANDPCAKVANNQQLSPDTEVYWRLYGLSDKDLLSYWDKFELTIGQSVSERLSAPDSDDGTSNPSMGDHVSLSSRTDTAALLDYLAHAAEPINKTEPIPIGSFKASRDVAEPLFTGKDLTVRWKPLITPVGFPHRRFDIVLNATTTPAGVVPPLAAKSSAGSHSVTPPFLVASGVLVPLLSVACSLYM